MSKFNSVAVELDIVADNAKTLPNDIVEYCEANNIGFFVATRPDVDNLPVLFTAAKAEDLKEMINAVYETQDKEQQEFYASMITEI